MRVVSQELQNCRHGTNRRLSATLPSLNRTVANANDFGDFTLFEVIQQPVPANDQPGASPPHLDVGFILEVNFDTFGKLSKLGVDAKPEEEEFAKRLVAAIVESPQEAPIDPPALNTNTPSVTSESEILVILLVINVWAAWLNMKGDLLSMDS
jgi:hypothetical protein